MFKNISIIGDGGMGTALSLLLSEKAIATRIWGHDREQLAQIARDRENKKFLPGYALPEELVFEPDDARIMSGADLIVSAVPCQFMRGVWSRLRDHVPEGIAIVSVAKGVENKTLLRPTQ
ncbi:MAG: NAD(P)-binding domain-containing protein, partial [Planctomycetota bacterium]